MRSKLAGLRDHFVICGFGRVGREVSNAFREEGVPFVVVDSNPVALSLAEEHGLPYVQGDATNNETLESAGIVKARGLVAAVGSDRDNVFITPSARGLKQDLYIVARNTDPETEGKLYRAGADRVISPHAIGGRHMALSAIEPTTHDSADRR